MKRMIALILLSFAALIAANLAHAEGCEEGPQHAPNAKEKAYYSSEFKALRNALPKPPAGWQYSDADKDKLDPAYTDVPDYLCGTDQSYYIGLDMDYERPMTEADSQKEMQAMQAKPDPAKQKKLDGLMAQQQALMQKSLAAAQKQDYKAMDVIGKQSDALNAQITQVQLDMNAGERAALDAVQRDRTAKVRIAVNDAGDASCYGSPKAIPVPGAIAYQCENPATYSSPGNQLDAPKGRVVVVFGKGAQAESGDWERKDEKDQEHKDSYVSIKYTVQQGSTPAVQFVTVDVEGDDLARAMSLYKQMDLAPLAALIKK
jgi:hypothetical protein